MHGHGVSWDVPDFGRQLPRVTVSESLAGAGDRLRVISAPSGWGKTLAAAQYARYCGLPTLWLDAFGECIAPERIAQEVLLYLSERGHGSMRLAELTRRSTDDLLDAIRGQACLHSGQKMLVVIDDVAVHDDSALTGLLRVHGALRRTGGQVLVTTRASLGTKRDEIWVAGPSLLALSHEEIRELSQGLVDPKTLRQETQGHPALVSLMSRQALQDDGTVSVEVQDWIRTAAASLPYESRMWLHVLGVLKSGTDHQLVELGMSRPSALLDELSEALPLVRVSRRRNDGLTHFHVHDLAESWLTSSLLHVPPGDWPVSKESLLHTLGCVDDSARACRIVLRCGNDDEILRWSVDHGQALLESGHARALDELLDKVGLHRLVEHPMLLALWADAALALDRPSDAYGRAKAAADLASHDGDMLVNLRSTRTRIDALQRLDRHDEAMAQAQVLYGRVAATADSGSVLEALVLCARLSCNIGQIDQAAEALDQAAVLAESCDAQQRAEVSAYRAIVRCLRCGEYAEAVQALSCGPIDQQDWLSERVAARGNLAVALIECGRLQRARPLARYVAAHGDSYHRAAFASLIGQVHYASGELEDGQAVFEGANRLCVECGAEYDLALNRVYLSTCLRSMGGTEEALSVAERAFERLCSLDFMGFRRLAALEIAASLLALGDIAAARRWTDPLVSEGFGGNAYHALRAAMVLAECDRREGDLEQAVERIAEHADHIRTESSNWQIAMYCRAFPELLGLFTRALGAANLPAHMLKIVLPEYGERSLTLCKSWLEPAEWRRLGRRLLGDAGFAQLDRRKGKPICRVRLFGGLDVTVAERTVTEKDWKKRKARLLFAMLVVRQGRDLAREQLFDHLWPDLSETKARNNYYVIWSAMKGALMGEKSRSTACPYVENTGGRCRIVTDAVRSDIDEFEEALQEARTAEAVSDAPAALAAYARLSMVYRGDLLPGDVYDDWFSDMRERYRFEFVDAMVHASELLLRLDDPCEALAYARRALRVDALREDLYQMALRCQIAAGQRSGAIDTFIQCRTRLSEELGLDPSGETMELYQEVLVMEDRPRYDDFGLS